MTNEKVYTTEWLGRTLTIKTGKLAMQADAAVTVQYGDTVVMATVVESKTERQGIDFFPLMVDFEERLYAAGIIKGSRWVKREGRPSDDSILTGRMVDRAIRPLFDESSRKDVQVIITVLSVDQENDYDVISLVAASSALAISGVKWNGPIGGVRVGRVNGELNFNPTYKDREGSDLDLIVAGTDKKAIMIEASANEVPESEMLKALLAGQKEMQPAIELIKKMKKEIGSVKNKVVKEKLIDSDDIIKDEIESKVLLAATEWLEKNIKPILFDKIYYTKGERKAAVAEIKIKLDEFLFAQGINKDLRAKAVSSLVESMVEAEVTNSIINEGKRVDGRKLDEIRLLTAEVGILPRNHGAGLFSRGETQVMSIVTLGSPGMEQTLEGMEGQGKKRYMHHYNFAPYCVGEAKPMRGAGRREIGHGALAEKALVPVLPTKEDFPYTVRVVSETLGSNGSSSMGSTCASTLALMDAGVPIKKAVAGIAMGLASNENMSKWEVLTDIQDLEDGKGGMDFKMTGTAEGLTAIQLDTKTTGLTEEMMAKALTQGRNALNQILEVMQTAIPAPRAELSKYAPRIYTLNIKPEQIGSVIGPGGKIINEIIAATGVAIDIDDDGLVMITGTDSEMCAEAVRRVKEIVHEFAAGEIYTGKVVRLLDFGAFVELSPSQDGMVHVSELAPYRIGKPSDFMNVGDMVTVKIKEIDDQGRINLTMKGLEENAALWKDEKGKQEGGGTFGGGRPPRSGNGGGRNRY
jgi:polyribonucleotide nucleotidyltransferase